MMKRTLNALRLLSPNCREAASLISDATARRLSPFERIGLKLHLVICRACRAYRHSVRVLAELMRATCEDPTALNGEALPEAAKDRILHKIQGP